jgi:hypothetical protein
LCDRPCERCHILTCKKKGSPWRSTAKTNQNLFCTLCSSLLINQYTKE